MVQDAKQFTPYNHSRKKALSSSTWSAQTLELHFAKWKEAYAYSRIMAEVKQSPEVG